MYPTMKHGGDEHRPPGGFITPNVGHRLSPRFSSLSRSGCERSEFPDISFFNKTHEIDIEFHEVSYEVSGVRKEGAKP